MALHREVFRNLQGWHIAYLQGDVSDVISNGQIEVCLWDALTLYDARGALADQQALAIRLCLFENLAESKVATLMGIDPDCPVSIYANVGIARLLGMVNRGEIKGYSLDPETGAVTEEPKRQREAS